LVSGCKKEQAAAVAGTSAAKSVTAATSVSRAAGLGFAAHLPTSTEAYFGTLNLPAHAKALKETNYFKDLSAFLDDRVPAPAAGAVPDAPIKPKALDKLAWNDFFISLGKGSAKSLASLQKFSAFYSELSYRALMSGSQLPKTPPPTTPPGIEPEKPSVGDLPGNLTKNPVFAALFADPELVKRVADALVDLELPPIMIGIHADKPDEVLKQLIPEDLLANVRKKAKVSQVTTALSGQFTLIEGTGKDVYTDELKKTYLALLPPEAAELLPMFESAYTTMQSKKVALAYGTVGGYVVVTIGSNRPDLDFVVEPATSLAARPEFSVMTPFQAKDLTAVMFMEGATLQAMQNPEPLQPIMRGLLAGLKQSPVFGGMAKALEPKVAALAPIEHQLHAKPLTTLVGVGWWDKGLHMEFDGGVSPKGIEGAKPLKFASLIDDPDALLAVNYHGDPQTAAIARAYMEALADVLRTAGLELAKANFFGEQGTKMASWIDLEIVPQLVSFYNASKTMYARGVGNEHAWVLDLGGHMPALPGLPPPDPKGGTKMLRVAGVDEVLDRKLISDSWTQMEAALTGMAKAFPMLGGQGLPAAETSSKSGMNFSAYALPFDSEDLLLCASVGDKVCMLGTSKSQQEDIAARLLRAAPSPDTPTALWRLSWPKVREAVKTFAPEAPAAPAADNMKAVSKWMAPLGEMRGRFWIEAGHVRNSFSWDMKDTTKFD
ncbi:MAG: hypothetical protein JWO94_3704, partial [Verrucomicrobiaceae bacterium]|nr:hypothetical protein [Verrucomicrobiaceae bacterium]